MKGYMGILLGLGFALLASCATPASNAAWFDRMKVQQMNRVVVLPLENLSDNAQGPVLMMDLLTNYLYQTERFRIMERAEMNRRFTERRVDLPPVIDRTAALQAGRFLEVDGVFYGTITEYGYLFYPEDAVIGLRLFLLDVQTGQIVWTAMFNHTRRGLIHGSDEPLSGLAQTAAREMIRNLAPTVHLE